MELFKLYYIIWIFIINTGGQYINVEIQSMDTVEIFLDKNMFLFFKIFSYLILIYIEN